MIPARGPPTRLKKHIWGNPGVQSDVVKGVRFTYTCYGMIGIHALGLLGLPWGCQRLLFYLNCLKYS